MLSYTEPAVSVAEADAYAALRGWADWMGTDALKAGAIRRSQDFIAANYNNRWRSEWANNAAPAEVKYAIIEGARRELARPGSLDPDVVKNAIRKREKVEGAVEVEYAVSESASAQDSRPVISIIDNLLADHITQIGFGGSVGILRF